jgi:lysophospholipase L1-like esterase
MIYQEISVKRSWRSGVAALIVTGGFAWSGSWAAADIPATAPATAPSGAPATVQETPIKRPPSEPDVASPKWEKDGLIEKGFWQKHESFLKRKASGPIGLLFLGDSITEGWGKARDIWNEHYAKDDVANFGISGDRTEHVLWRIESGELDRIAPKVVVLMIGTNNIGAPQEKILAGVTKVVAEIHENLPQSRLLLLAVFPRGADPADKGVASMRDKIKFVNEGLAKLDDGDKTRYLDIGPKFLDPDGKLPKEIMPDALHPNVKGYQIWADAMQPLLDEMMK